MTTTCCGHIHMTIPIVQKSKPNKATNVQITSTPTNNPISHREVINKESPLHGILNNYQYKAK